MPFFSVILPVYNAEDTVVRAVESVLAQSYSSFEIIIIDDCSNDDTLERVLQLRCKKIFVLRNKINEGVSFSRNRGIHSAKGDFVTFLDADDEWLPNKLELQKKFIDETHSEAVFGNYYIRKNKRITAVRKNINGKYTYNRLLEGGNPIGCLTVSVNRRFILQHKLVFKKIGHEDYDFWLQAAKKGIVFNFQKDFLAIYDDDVKGLSSNKLMAFIWTWKIYQSQKDIGLLKVIALQAKYVFRHIMKF